MLRTGFVAVIALTVVLAGGIPSAVRAGVPAPHVSKNCGVTSKGSRDYRVKGRALKCKFARRWVKRYFRRGRVAPGFSCVNPSSGPAPFYCTKGSAKAYWAERL